MLLEGVGGRGPWSLSPLDHEDNEEESWHGGMTPARKQHTSVPFVLTHMTTAARDHTQLQSRQEGTGWRI